MAFQKRSNKKKNYPGKLYFPLIIIPLVLFVVMAIPVFLISRNQLENTGKLSAEKFYIQASSFMNELKTVNDAIASNDFINQVLNEEYTNSYTTSIITSMLNNQIKKFPHINEVYVLSQRHNKTYTSDAVYTYGSAAVLLAAQLFTGGSPATEFNEALLKEGWSAPRNSYSTPYYVSFIKDASGKKVATLITMLNKTYFLRTMSSTASDFSCIYNKDFILSSTLLMDLDKDYTSAEGVASVIGEPASIYTVSDSEFTYMVGIASRSFYRPLYIILIAMGLYFVVVLLFFIISTASRKKRDEEFFAGLIKELPQPEASEDTPQSVIDSIQASLDNYKKEHIAYVNQMRFRNLRSLALGNFDPSLEDEFVSSIGLPKDAYGYYALNLNVSYDSLTETKQNTDFICVILETMLGNLAEGRYTPAVFPVDKDLGAVIALHSRNVTSDDIYEDMSTTLEMATNDYGIQFRSSVSDMVPSLNDIPKAYFQALDISRFVFAIGSHTKVLTADQLQNTPGVLMDNEFLNQTQILSNALFLHKYELAVSIVDSILDTQMNISSEYYGMVNDRLHCISTLLCEVPFPEKVSPERAREIRDALHDANTIADLRQVVHTYFEDMNTYSKDQSQVEKAREFIDDQIANISLNVPDVAEYVGISVQYLSRLFRAELNMTVVEYINKVRIDKAKALLTSSSYNVTEIAEMTGYCNNVTFSRNFRKFVECTPSEYRTRTRR